MNSIKTNNLKYINILNRIHKKLSKFEALLIIKKQYFTDNKFYYLLCLSFRFFYLISFLGDYHIFFDENKTNKLFPYNMQKFTCYNLLIKEFKISFNFYSNSILILFFISLIRVLVNSYIYKRINDYKNTNIWPLPNKYLIIIDHLRFAMFPYLIEYLSFPYYIIFLFNKFLPGFDTNDQTSLIILIILVTLLIILYNFDLFWDMNCINKKFNISIIDISAKINENKNYINRNNHFSYKCPIYILYIFIILQNTSILLNLEYFMNNKKMFKIIFTIFIFILILIIIYKLLNTFDYQNYILIIMNILFLFCFYSIILDLIVTKFLHKKLNMFNHIIYAFLKIIISYILLSIIILKRNNLFKNKIIQLLFIENNDEIEKGFIDTLYYLHEIMLKIKIQKNIESALTLIEFINNKHIKACTKPTCNCKLFNSFINEKIINSNELMKYNEKLTIILNYLFESVFIDYDFFNNYDACVLIAEHFCHNKDNPIMAFSIVNTFFTKYKNRKLSKQRKVLLYELSQKYIYYITSKLKRIKEIKQDEEEFLLNDDTEEEFNFYFYSLKNISKLKTNMINYLKNFINILKYKNIFDDSLSFIYDENNEKVISVKNNFFKKINKIDKESIKNNKNNENKNNLYNIIYLLKKEKYFYRKIKKSIIYLDEMKEIPFEIIFKCILFINIFETENIQKEAKEKLYKFLNNNKGQYNIDANKDEYEILKIYYKRKYNEKDSKIYSIFEFKRELITKYFSEFGALKLGFKQNEIINEKMDLLIPDIFRSSHLNVIKYFIIKQQTKLNFSKQSYFFDKANTILYPINIRCSFIYNINKYFNFLVETFFIFENKYRFMLDNNLELVANSNNFEEDYYLNQKIFQIYNISIIDLLNIHPKKFKNIFKNEMNNIHHQKLIRQFKTEEYILPQLFVPPGEKPISMMNTNYFKKSKNKIISKILNLGKKDKLKNESEENINEFIQKDIHPFLELFTKSETIVFNKIYNKILNKKYFIEKIGKILLKIPDNDIIIEKDKVIHNLIMNSKLLICKLLSKHELSNQYIYISIEFRYFYDKFFYFITIKDEKNSFFKIHKLITFENLKNKKEISSNYFNKDLIKISSSNRFNEEKNIQKSEKTDEKDVYNKIRDIKNRINKNKFIFILKIFLSTIILFVLIINIVIIYFQRNISLLTDTILCSFFYNTHAKNIALVIYSLLLQIYYDYSNLTDNNINEDNEFQNILNSLSSGLQENFHNFTTFYIIENVLLGTNVNLIYEKQTFYKIRLFWKENEYYSDYTIDGDFLNYNLFLINITKAKGKEPEFIQDLQNFLFYKETSDSLEKINTVFIRILYYMCNNYEFVYRKLYLLFQEDVYKDFKIYVGGKMTKYKILENLGIILNSLFYFIMIIFLFYSNQIIIKNITFLFIDFNEDGYKNKKEDYIINLKLNELKQLIEDFNIKIFEKYIQNKNKIEINTTLYKNDSIIITNKKENKKNSTTNNTEKESCDKNTINSISRNKLLVRKNKGTNNSSYNQLTSYSNSQIFKNNLNNNSSKIDKNLVFNSIQKPRDNLVIRNEENEDYINEMILNSSNKNIILIIKVYFIIFSILFFGLIIFSYYKIFFNTKMYNGIDEFFIDFVGITDRYTILFYSYNIFKTLLIFPEGEKKRKFEKIMEKIDNYYEEENKKFLKIRANDIMITYFYRTTNFMDFLTESKNNSTNNFKYLICEDNISCRKYLDSEFNIFKSGIDFGFKSALTIISNMYLDYQKLNKSDINIINTTIIHNSYFKKIGLGLNNILLIVLDKIFLYFKDDINEFLLYKIKFTKLFNIIAFILLGSIFLFIIGFVFISIYKYTEPIKESTYRLNYSVCNIKKK